MFPRIFSTFETWWMPTWWQADIVHIDHSMNGYYFDTRNFNAGISHEYVQTYVSCIKQMLPNLAYPSNSTRNYGCLHAVGTGTVDPKISLVRIFAPSDIVSS